MKTWGISDAEAMEVRAGNNMFEMRGGAGTA